jgi:putative membrane protein
MDTLQNRRGAGKLLIVVLVAAVLGGCATSRKQPLAANAKANVAAAPAAAHPIAKKSKVRPALTRAASAPAVSRPVPAASSKTNAAAILAQIHQANLREIAIGKMAEGKASTFEIRSYADQLVQDHTNADRIVAATAEKSGTHLHESTVGPRKGRHDSAHGSPVEQKLSSATGAGFDRIFLQQTSTDQQGLIRSLQQDREDAAMMT